MYLSSTDPATKFSKDAAIQTIILGGSYFGAMILAGTQELKLKISPVNPALALGFVFINWKNLTSLWIFLGAPLLGSFLALIFYRFIYQRVTQI